MRLSSVALVLLALVLMLSGCGGGSGGGDGRPTVAIAWPAHGREFTAPEAAMSATIVFRSPAGMENPFLVDRPSSNAAQTVNHRMTSALPAGRYGLRIRFWSERGGLGREVGIAAASVALKDSGTLVRQDGTPLGTVGFTRRLASLSVTPALLEIGQATDLAVEAVGADGETVALAPGSVALSFPAGGARVERLGGTRLNPLVEGSVEAVASVDGLQSPPITLTITGRPIVFRTAITVADQLTLDPTRGWVWVTRPAARGGDNTVAAVDPATGTVVRSGAAGSEPCALALTSDGSKLYVGLKSTGRIASFDADTMAAGPSFALTGSSFEQTYASDIAPVPGSNTRIAVTEQASDSSGYYGPAVYEDGVMLPDRLGIYEATDLVWGAGTELVSVENGSSSGWIHRLSLRATGVTSVASVRSGGSLGLPVVADGRLYTGRGQVRDVASLAVLGEFNLDPAASGAGPWIDQAAHRAYFVTRDFGDSTTWLLSYSTETFVRLSKRRLTGDSMPSHDPGLRGRLIHVNGTLVASTGNRLLLIDLSAE